jgi:hypothetical protein
MPRTFLSDVSKDLFPPSLDISFSSHPSSSAPGITTLSKLPPEEFFSRTLVTNWSNSLVHLFLHPSTVEDIRS